MKGAFVAGLVAMAFAAAGSATALAQTNKTASPDAVTSGSTAMALPAGGNAVQGTQAQSNTMSAQSPAMAGNAGVVEPYGQTSAKGKK